MHRLMLTSSAYRQASENTVCDGKRRRSGQPPALALRPPAAGSRSDPRRHPRRQRPAQPRAWAAPASSRRCPTISPTSRATAAAAASMWEPNENEEDARRRSVYIFQRRSLPLPMMAAFDAHGLQRILRPPQRHHHAAPGALDDERHLVHEEARAPGPSHRVRSRRRPPRADRPAFESVLEPPCPTPEETRQVLAASHGPLDGICRVLFNSNEFLYVE